MMDAEEREIFFYLKGFRGQFISSHEVCRRAGGKKRYQHTPEWAKPILVRMADRGILETDPSGYYRIKPLPESTKQKRWVSPQIARILKQSGKSFDNVIKVDEDPDSYYDSL